MIGTGHGAVRSVHTRVVFRWAACLVGRRVGLLGGLLHRCRAEVLMPACASNPLHKNAIVRNGFNRQSNTPCEGLE